MSWSRSGSTPRRPEEEIPRENQKRECSKKGDHRHLAKAGDQRHKETHLLGIVSLASGETGGRHEETSHKEKFPSLLTRPEKCGEFSEKLQKIGRSAESVPGGGFSPPSLCRG